jgi:succinate dehydrogenase / fumarate reductase, cytochrome b subunit
MRKALTLYRTSVGKKVLMALSGALLTGFVLAHMVGNLKMFQGAEAMDGYAVFLKTAGYPLLPEYGLLWIARIALLGAVGVHAVAAFQLWRLSRSARPAGYRKEQSQVFSYASRTMRWGGVIILLFVVFHLLHFTVGSAHPDFEYGAVYQNVVLGFQSVPVALFYLLAVGSLALHLYHGLWSLFSTLGVQNPRVQRIRRPLAAGLSVALFVGYASVPVAVLAGILTLP